jgi:hypothetical protein
MYCRNCECEFNGWKVHCPVCKSDLIEKRETPGKQVLSTLPYAGLVNLVKEHAGQLEVPLSAVKVQRAKRWHFPRFGYGYAWTEGFSGSHEDDFSVEMTTDEVGRDHQWIILGIGYGFAWEKTMQGDIGGNPFNLKATKVERKRYWIFFMVGFGYAWSAEMSGECGSQLSVDFRPTQVTRKRFWQFPGIGYGYAWPSQGVLTLRLKD